MSSVAGMFLINVSSEEAFICMRNLLERHCLRSFYGGPGARDDVSFLIQLVLDENISSRFFCRLKLTIGESGCRPLDRTRMLVLMELLTGYSIFDTLLADGLPKGELNYHAGEK